MRNLVCLAAAVTALSGCGPVTAVQTFYDCGMREPFASFSDDQSIRQHVPDECRERLAKQSRP